MRTEYGRLTGRSRRSRIHHLRDCGLFAGRFGFDDKLPTKLATTPHDFRPPMEPGAISLPCRRFQPRLLSCSSARSSQTAQQMLGKIDAIKRRRHLSKRTPPRSTANARRSAPAFTACWMRLWSRWQAAVSPIRRPNQRFPMSLLVLPDTDRSQNLLRPIRCKARGAEFMLARGQEIGSFLMRMRSSVNTTIEPPSRSSDTVSTFARRTAA